MFWNLIFQMLLKKLNSANNNDSYWLGQLIYLSMINQHIIWVEFGSNSINATYGFNIKAHYSKKKSIYELKCSKWMIYW